MPALSMTTLVDIVSRAGTPKATCISRAKNQDVAGYDPAADYYKSVREAIVSHSIDNPLDVENNIILPLQSQVKPPPEIPYATNDIMELLAAKYSWNES
jgi:hypothetical protein